MRTTTLFELQAENAITYMGAHRRYVASDAEQFDHATAASSLEGDVSADPFWPAFAPDGKAPKPGWRWYALYDRDVDEDKAEGAKDEDRPLRVRQGRKRVIQVRFNMSVPRARVPAKASTRRERSQR